MQDVNVVIVFYSRTGLTERMALAAAVGAVQGRALIRLRRIGETASEETIAGVSEWKQNHERMNQEYIAPREIDILWAEGLVLAVPDWLELSSAQVQGYLDLLADLRVQGKLEGKFAAVCAGKGLENSLTQAGLELVPGPKESADAVDRARQQGFQVAEAARAARQARSATSSTPGAAAR